MRKLFLLVAAVFGTLAGFLFAPRSGKETRDKIAGEIKKGGSGIGFFKDDAKKIGKDIVETVKEVSGSSEVKQMVKKGKMKAKMLYGKGKKEVKAVIKEGRKIVEQELEKGKSKLDAMTDRAYSFGLRESKKLKKIVRKKRGKKK